MGPLLGPRRGLLLGPAQALLRVPLLGLLLGPAQALLLPRGWELLAGLKGDCTATWGSRGGIVLPLQHPQSQLAAHVAGPSAPAASKFDYTGCSPAK